MLFGKFSDNFFVSVKLNVIELVLLIKLNYLLVLVSKSERLL